MTNWADIRKTTANTLVAVAGVGGQLANATVVHGQGALWLAFGITAVQGVAHVLVTYSVPNGATTAQRLTALEKAALPVAETVAVAADKVMPHNPILADVEKVLYVGSPSTSGNPAVVTPVTPAAAPADPVAALQQISGGSNVSG